jgi:hypothetical protein
MVAVAYAIFHPQHLVIQEQGIPSTSLPENPVIAISACPAPIAVLDVRENFGGAVSI